MEEFVLGLKLQYHDEFPSWHTAVTKKRAKFVRIVIETNADNSLKPVITFSVNL